MTHLSATKLKNGSIIFDDSTSIDLMCTLRLPEDGVERKARRGSSKIQSLVSTAEEGIHLPPYLLNKPGYIVCLHQREALWLNVHEKETEPRAFCFFIGGQVDAISGKQLSANSDSDRHKFDYVGAAAIDAFDFGDGIIRQLVAPLSQGSFESSIFITMHTPKLVDVSLRMPCSDEIIQMQVPACALASDILRLLLELKPELFASPEKRVVLSKYGDILDVIDDIYEMQDEQLDILVLDREDGDVFEACIKSRRGYVDCANLVAIGSGDKMNYFSNHRDIIDFKTDAEHTLGTWIHVVNAAEWHSITGKPAPESPITKSMYTRYDVPWFANYDIDTRYFASGQCDEPQRVPPRHIPLYFDTDVPFEIFELIASFIPALPCFFDMSRVCSTWYQAVDALLEYVSELDLVPKWASVTEDPCLQGHQCPLACPKVYFSKLRLKFPSIEHVDLFSSDMETLPDVWNLGPAPRSITLLAYFPAAQHERAQVASLYHWLQRLPLNVQRVEIVNVSSNVSSFGCTSDSSLVPWLKSRTKVVPSFRIELKGLNEKGFKPRAQYEHQSVARFPCPFDHQSMQQLLNYLFKKHGLLPNLTLALFDSYGSGIAFRLLDSLDEFVRMGGCYSPQTIVRSQHCANTEVMQRLIDNCPEYSKSSHLKLLERDLQLVSLIPRPHQLAFLKHIFEACPDLSPSSLAIKNLLSGAAIQSNFELYEYVFQKYGYGLREIRPHTTMFLQTLLMYAATADWERFERLVEFLTKTYGDIDNFLRLSDAKLHDFVNKQPVPAVVSLVKKILAMDPKACFSIKFGDAPLHTWAKQIFFSPTMINDDVLFLGEEILGHFDELLVGAVLRQQNERGETPLMSFISQDSLCEFANAQDEIVPRVVSLLLPRRVDDWFLLNKDGNTVIDLAARSETVFSIMLQRAMTALPEVQQRKLFFGSFRGIDRDCLFLEILCHRPSLVSHCLVLTKLFNGENHSLVHLSSDQRTDMQITFPRVVPLLHGIILAQRGPSSTAEWEERRISCMQVFNQVTDYSVLELQTNTSALACAVMTASNSLVEMLLQYGLASHLPENKRLPLTALVQKFTPLMLAIRNKRDDVAKMIMKHEQDSLLNGAGVLKKHVDAKTLEEWTAQAMAMKKKQSEAHSALSVSSSIPLVNCLPFSLPAVSQFSLVEDSTPMAWSAAQSDSSGVFEFSASVASDNKEAEASIDQDVHAAAAQNNDHSQQRKIVRRSRK